jgi:hypothetical protein
VPAARQLTVFKFTDRRGTEGDEGDPFRVGGVYGGYGNRLAKVMTGISFQRTLNEALVAGFKARGVDATGIPDRELGFGVIFETPLALGGELRNFSTESRWSKSAHISGILRLYDRRGAVLVEKRVSARDQGGLGAGVFASSEPLEELMKEALREFVRMVVTDAEERSSDRRHPRAQVCRFEGPAFPARRCVSDEARELHRVISATVRDMLSAYRIQAPPDSWAFFSGTM